MNIEVKQLNKRFADHVACQTVSFKIEKGKLIGLLGPSGSGKTTILRMLAGLETPDSGDIRFDGTLVNALSPQERKIGFVFQHYALFRHMTVFDNIAFGLTVQKKRKKAIRDRVYELLELTALNGLERRYPNQLSGGQRQRVAFARALAPSPQLLLLDEPFAAIDAKVRKGLRTWLKEMIETVGITTIFVTHDQEEAIEVADELLLIHEGRLEQMGTPYDIYKNPQTPFVAEFFGQSTFLEDPAELTGFASEGEGCAIVRPEYVEVGLEREFRTPHATEKGVVHNVFFRGSHWEVEVSVGPRRFAAYRHLDQPVLRPNDEVRVLIHRLYVFDDHKALRLIENPFKAERPIVHSIGR